MNKIAKLFLSTTPKIVAICSLIFIASLWIAVNVHNAVSWYVETDFYQKWLSTNATQVCAEAEKKCRQEISEKSEDSSDALSSIKKTPEQVNIYMPNYQACLKSEIKNTVCNVIEPEGLSERISKSTQVLDYAVAFLLPFFFYFTLRFFFQLKHLGWQRVTVVVAFLISIYIALEQKNSYIYVDNFEVVQYFVAYFMCLIALPFAGLNFYKWIREGFTSKEEAQNVVDRFLLDLKTVEPYAIDGKFKSALLKTYLVWQFFLLMLAIRAEKTIQIFAKVFVETLVLVTIIYIVKKLKK